MLMAIQYLLVSSFQRFYLCLNTRFCLVFQKNFQRKSDVPYVKERKNEVKPLTEDQYDDIIDSVLRKVATGQLFSGGD